MWLVNGYKTIRNDELFQNFLIHITALDEQIKVDSAMKPTFQNTRDNILRRHNIPGETTNVPMNTLNR